MHPKLCAVSTNSKETEISEFAAFSAPTVCGSVVILSLFVGLFLF